MGEKKYGTRLKTFNGRDALLDLQQEVYDAIVYAQQAKLEGRGQWSAYTVDELIKLANLIEAMRNV